jgi:hypothetical protein
MMLMKEGLPQRRFARAFALIAVFVVIVLVGIEATGLCPLVH